MYPCFEPANPPASILALQATGCYLARTLSYKGADFELDKIRLDASFRWVADRWGRTLRAAFVRGNCAPVTRTGSTMAACVRHPRAHP